MTHKGYIYIRTNSYWDADDICKMGKTKQLAERDGQYATSELRRGRFSLVVEVVNDDWLERQLQQEFQQFNVHVDGGVELFNKAIIFQIEPYLKRNGIQHRILSGNEIDDMVRLYKMTTNIQQDKDPTTKMDAVIQQICLLTPRQDQQLIIDQSVAHFEHVAHKGVLVLMCGIGKTLLSLWITQRLWKLSLFINTSILIGVPNLLLLKQWKGVIQQLFPAIPVLLVKSQVSTTDIIQWIQKYPNGIVISMYQSSLKLVEATTHLHYTFGMKILDEVHHLTTSNVETAETKRSNIQILRVPAINQLSLTATLKDIEKDETNTNIISNADTEHFGNVIDEKGLLWAIRNNIVCDYHIQTIVTKDDQIDAHLSLFRITDADDARLWHGAYSGLKSIQDGHSHHLLIYANTHEQLKKTVKYIRMLLNEHYFNLPDLYYEYYDSIIDTTSKEQKQKNESIMAKFKSCRYGIIACAYCLGEGWDFPALDGVVIPVNMTSSIRIVQSILRASRKNSAEPNKITKIILPILNCDEYNDICDKKNESDDLKKVREVIKQLADEDESIEHKIKAFTYTIEKYDNNTKIHRLEYNELCFGDYDDELTQKIRLKTVKRTECTVSFEKARKILADHHVKSKDAYYELCKINCRLTPTPETRYKSFNWVTYLSIEADMYYDVETCKRKATMYVKEHSELKTRYHLNLVGLVKELCRLDPLFPPHDLWVELYEIPLETLIVFPTVVKKSKVLI